MVRRAALLLLMPLIPSTAGGCFFDRSGVSTSSTDTGPGKPDATADGPSTREGTGILDQLPLPHDQPPAPEVGPTPDGPSVPCAGLTCPLECNVTANRCYRVKPTGFDPSSFFDQVTGVVATTGPPITINTESGAIVAGSTTLRPAGSPGQVLGGFYWSTATQGPGYPDVAIFGVASVDLKTGQQLLVTGTYALALYATGNVTIAGELRAGGNGQIGGPGGYNGGTANGDNGAPCFGGEGKGGNEGGSGGSQTESGGGGGGRVAAGGKGGDSTYSPYPAGGAGGSAVGGTAILWPLFGGCGGGAGGGPDTGYSSNGNGGNGGGGGGAVQLVANGTLSVTGIVLAGGAGGDGGHYGAGGGGGGAGGAILLEAAEIAITGSGMVAANGGGGGSGCEDYYEANAPDGQDGQPSTLQAPGGPYNPTYGGAGGAGGATSPENGSAGQSTGNAGGGGGAAGVVRLVAKKTSATANSISPAHTTGSPAVW
jgi:hypothetical protein